MNEDYHYEIPLASEEELKIALEVEELRKKLEQIRNDPVVIQKTKEIIEARQKARQEAIRNPTHEIERDGLRAISKAAGEALMFLELDPSYARDFLTLIRDAWSFEEEE